MKIPMKDHENLKSESESIARGLGYALNPGLPSLDGVSLQKTIDDVVRRVLVLNCVVAVAHRFQGERAKDWLDQNKLLGHLSSRERDLIDGRSEIDRREFMVQGESLWVFAWAINKVDRIDYAKICGDSLVTLLPDLLIGESAKLWSQGLHLRSESEIVAACDLSYRIHWAVRDSQVHRKKLPGRVPAYVVVERRRALEWMLQENDWDDVVLDT